MLLTDFYGQKSFAIEDKMEVTKLVIETLQWLSTASNGSTSAKERLQGWSCKVAEIRSRSPSPFVQITYLWKIWFNKYIDNCKN